MKITHKPSGSSVFIGQQDMLPAVLAANKWVLGDCAIEMDAYEKKQQVRDNINQLMDQSSREGVISDVLGVVVVGLAQLAVALSKAKTLADVNAAAQPLADIGTAVDTAVKSGALKLPYMVKSGGAQGVLADMTKLSNGVAAVFAAAQTPAK